jgi:hypothetical protein
MTAYPISSPISNGNATDAAQLNNVRLDALRSLYPQKNNSGGSVDLGSVCVCDFSATVDPLFKLTSIQGDVSVCGVVVNTSIANLAYGYLAKTGFHTVKVKGNVIAGHRLIASSTPGYAMDSGRIQRSATGDIGMAMTNFTGTTGTVIADLLIQPYSSSNILQQLPNIADQYTNAASGSYGDTIESGTDLYISLILMKYVAGGTNPFTSIALNGSGLTQTCVSTGSAHYHCAAGYTRNPAIGAGTIAWVRNGADQTAVLSLHFIGSQVSAIRGTPVFSYLESNSVAVVTGDIVLDFIYNYGSASEVPSDGQSILWNPATGWYFALKQVTASGNEAFTWTGTLGTAGGIHGTIVLAGS